MFLVRPLKPTPYLDLDAAAKDLETKLNELVRETAQEAYQLLPRRNLTGASVVPHPNDQGFLVVFKTERN